MLVHDKVALRAAVERETVGGRVVKGEGGARLDRGDDDALVDEPHSGDIGGLGENPAERRSIGVVAARPVPIERDIARRLRPDERRLRLCRLGKAGNRRERGIIDSDQFGGVARRSLGLRDNQRHRLAGMARPAGRERRAVRQDQRLATRHRGGDRQIAEPCRLEIGRGQNREHPRLAPRLQHIDLPDVGAGMGRADKDGVGRAGQSFAFVVDSFVVDSFVVGKPAGAGQQPPVFKARLVSGDHRCRLLLSGARRWPERRSPIKRFPAA